MEKDCILGIDQGSTGSKVAIVNVDGEKICSVYRSLESICPQDGWLEHDPEEIWGGIHDCLVELKKKCDFKRIRAIGITNQRETTILWDRASGKPLSPAISWQCQRTGSIVERWESMSSEIFERLGLVCNTYFSASKIAWLLERDPQLRKRAERGEVCFGNVNTWIIWKLTGGRSHYTDSSNAGRTLLFDIQSNNYAYDVMAKLNIPPQIMPEVLACDADFGVAVEPKSVFTNPIPIRASIGDQMSALFGHTCFNRGEAKCTIGTAMTVIVNTGKFEMPYKDSGSIPAIACNRGGELSYELEGGAFVAGSVNEWLIEKLGIVSSPAEVGELSKSVTSSDGVYLVPFFQGIGAPYWDDRARALIIGLSRYHDKRHICRAAMESIALQAWDVIRQLDSDFGIKIQRLRVDGGVSKSDHMMQILADVLGCTVERPINTDCTMMGAVYLAGLSSSLWKDYEELRGLWHLDRAFEPVLAEHERIKLINGWSRAVQRSLNWAE